MTELVLRKCLEHSLTAGCNKKPFGDTKQQKKSETAKHKKT